MTIHGDSTLAPAAVPESSARVELSSRVSRRMRVFHALARRTVRPFLDGFASLEPTMPALVPPFLWVSSNVEVVAKALVPVPGTTCRGLDFEDFTAEWVWHADRGPSQVARGAILYCHGGGFLFGGLHSHRRLASRIARTTGLPVLNVDYRQLPEAAVRESQADALTAYRHLLDHGFPPDRILFAGDSAGGGLIFSTALTARTEGLPMPAGIMAISPLADYEPDARFGHPNDQTDAMLSAKSVATALRLALPDGDPDHSPLHHDFTGLPPVLIQVGGTEVFLSDAEDLLDRCGVAGVPCDLQVWEGAVHVFHAFADLAPEGHRAIDEMGRFARSLVDPARPLLSSVNTAA